MQKSALILGIQGQDGALLADHLISCGYIVFGGARNLAEYNNWRLKELNILDKIQIEFYSIEDINSLRNLLIKSLPLEIYLLAGNSKTYDSFNSPLETIELTMKATINLLDLSMKILPNSKIFLAGSSEMYGRSSNSTGELSSSSVDELSYCQPLNPYGVSKLSLYNLGRLYREYFKLHIVTGVLFNHESPLRQKHFVTRKITSNLVRIMKTGGDFFTLGNINMRRDWCDARDIVRGMQQSLAAPTAEDYIFSSGETHSVREFLGLAAIRCGFFPEFDGVGMDEILRCRSTNKVLMRISPKHFRVLDTPTLTGNPSKALKNLGWSRQFSFENMVNQMVDIEIQRWNTGHLFH
jgi:GDPmannose 4,6-dehydratase